MTEPKRQNNPRLLHKPVRLLMDKLGAAIYADPAFDKLSGHPLETFRSLKRSCFLWGKGRTVEDFQRIKLGSYARFANPSAAMVSWLEHPNQSMHYRACAFDLVLQEKNKNWIRKLLTPIWSRFYKGENIYAKAGFLANQIGLRSFEHTYQQDSFHFELPIISQPKDQDSCYVFALFNALQKIRPDYRKMKKEELRLSAIDFYKKFKKEIYLENGIQKRLQKKDVFMYAEWSGLIYGYEEKELTKDSFKKTSNSKAWVIFQGFGGGRKRWTTTVKQGKGIYKHAYVADSFDGDSLWCRNSYKECPMFLLNDLSVISKSFLIW